MSEFKFLKKDINVQYNYNKYENLIQLEIAFQLKRIADAMEKGKQNDRRNKNKGIDIQYTQ